jgi:hypothetical protein
LSTLFPVPKSFLGCPATTAELERVISKAGKLHHHQRKSVLDVTFEQQLFAAFNWKCYSGIEVRIALTAHDASTHLTEWDETMAGETRGGAEAYLETLGEVFWLGCQWADFA